MLAARDHIAAPRDLGRQRGIAEIERQPAYCRGATPFDPTAALVRSAFAAIAGFEIDDIVQPRRKVRTPAMKSMGKLFCAHRQRLGHADGLLFVVLTLAAERGDTSLMHSLEEKW